MKWFDYDPTDLIGMPYDFRLPPMQLERRYPTVLCVKDERGICGYDAAIPANAQLRRDQYFFRLKTTIEAVTKAEKRVHPGSAGSNAFFVTLSISLLACFLLLLFLSCSFTSAGLVLIEMKVLLLLLILLETTFFDIF